MFSRSMFLPSLCSKFHHKHLQQHFVKPSLSVLHKMINTIPNNLSSPTRELLLEKLKNEDEGIMIMTMNRHKVKNALGRQLLSEFEEAIDYIKNDKDIRVIILNSGVEGVYCAGADLKERATMSQDEASLFVQKIRQTFTNIENLPQPTIASIDGVAFGGGLELALACDLRVAGQAAKMGLVETSLAIIPGAGGTQRLPRLIGKSKATELILTSRKFDAQYAYKIGLINNISNTKESINEALKLAREILPNGPIALKMAKKAINEGLNAGNMEKALKIEQECYGVVIPTQDRLEALKAFKEKRKPVFKGV